VSIWTWAAASCRGTSHDKSDTPLQDAFLCFATSAKQASESFVGVVSDGAGSATFARQGAVLVCRTIGTALRQHFRDSTDLPTNENFEQWLDTTRDRIFAAAQRRALTPRDFASTLVSAVSRGTSTIVAHVGDGCVVVKDEASGAWIAPTWPDQGEYASTTSFVIDDGAVKLRVTHHEGDISALALFSDGLERLALDFLTKQPFPGFFDGMFAAVLNSTENGRDRELSRDLTHYLNSDVVNARTDDDKTLILAVRR
jgi:hypothetical protein